MFFYSCSDAAERNRLDATTFRLLNFGIILDAVQTVSSTLPITVAIARSSSYLRSIFGILCLYHAYLTASTSYSALTNFGIPVIKFGVAGPLSAAYLVTFLDIYAALWLTSWSVIFLSVERDLNNWWWFTIQHFWWKYPYMFLTT